MLVWLEPSDHETVNTGVQLQLPDGIRVFLMSLQSLNSQHWSLQGRQIN